jgi:hypothetical protein
MNDVYDRNGQPIDSASFGRLLSDRAYKKIGLTKVADGEKSFTVSTVWLGINHRYGDGPPLIFETMVFGEGSMLDLACARYSTEQEAREGHRAMVLLVTADMDTPAVTDVDDF